MSKFVPLDGFGRIEKETIYLPSDGENSGGNADSSLNFNVVAYTTEEELLFAEPEENTVGVVTDIPINGWHVGYAPPTNPAEGIIYISTGATSSNPINLDKENTIYLYPIAISQYYEGEWINRLGYTYMKESWHSICNILLDANGFDTSLTGTWRFVTNTGSTGSGSASIGTNSVTISGSSSSSDVSARYMVVTHDNPIDVTGYKYLEVDVTLSYHNESQNNYFYFGVAPKKGESSISAFGAIACVYQKSGLSTNILDVSNVTGTMYVTLSLHTSYRGSATAVVSGIRLK